MVLEMLKLLLAIITTANFLGQTALASNAYSSFAQSITQTAIPHSEIYGYWMTEEKDGVIEIYPCESGVCGKFHWLKDDSESNPSLDDKNKNPELRQRRLCGLQFMGGFKQKDGNKFSGGWIYSVRDGNTYSAELSLKDNDTLELRGYFLIPLLGESRLWKRTSSQPACSL